jgi:uncharacterized membrane protein (DUF485 family)
LIASIVSGEASEAMARVRRKAIIYLAAGFLCLCGVGFLIVAGFIAAAQEIGAVEAALAFAGGFIVVALLLLGIGSITARARERRIAKRRKSEARALAGAAAFAMLPTLLASRKAGLALVVPAVAALAWAVMRENTPPSDDADNSPD